MGKLKNIDTISLGLIYYPEHWPESIWEDDLRRINEMGFRILRIAEFSWSRYEPVEGKYTFEFWDKFLALAVKYDMKVIFGTPTATPPAWVTHKYPETLNVRRDGVTYSHGSRRHYNYNSPKYQELCAKIVTKIAEHYGRHPAILGWQIDNELNCELDSFYSKSDHVAFREYLKNKFGTLEKLNEVFGTAFWNQQYTDWDQVGLTGVLPSDAYNPHQLLEEKRFISRSAINFVMIQYTILKKYIDPGQFISTNGLFNHLDYHELADKALDFVAFDSFPCFAFNLEHHPEKDRLNDRRWSWNMIRSRSIKGTFAVFEQSSYAGGWICRMQGPTPKPGQLRLWTYMGFAHGADYAGFYRWRSCSFGVEMYWHGMNHYSNKPNKGYYEIKDLIAEVKKIREITGSEYQAKVAIVKDYDNAFDGEYDVWHGPHDYLSDDAWFTATQLTHTPCDFLYLWEKTKPEDLEKYNLLVYPHAAILPKNRADMLRAYAENGGTLIMGARTGYKDMDGHCPMMDMPGYAKDICGAIVEDFSFIGSYDSPQFLVWNNKKLSAPYFNDIIEPSANTAEVVAWFEGNYYDGKPAMVRNRLGRGNAYYVGSVFSGELAREFLHYLGLSQPYHDYLELPEQCELAVRCHDTGKQYFFVLNYKEYPAKIKINKPMQDLLTGKNHQGRVALEPYGVMILTLH
jgi:beta-galactosidase